MQNDEKKNLDGFRKNLCILVLSAKVASSLEGIILFTHAYRDLHSNSIPLIGFNMISFHNTYIVSLLIST